MIAATWNRSNSGADVPTTGERQLLLNIWGRFEFREEIINGRACDWNNW